MNNLTIIKNYSSQKQMERDIEKMRIDWEVISTTLPEKSKTKSFMDYLHIFSVLINNLAGNSDWLNSNDGDYKVVYKKK